jgi:hypothetical protein
VNARELKYQISVRLLQHMAEAEGLTFAEYSRVYDSEKHEQLLIDVMRLIAEADL